MVRTAVANRVLARSLLFSCVVVTFSSPCCHGNFSDLHVRRVVYDVREFNSVLKRLRGEGSACANHEGTLANGVASFKLLALSRLEIQIHIFWALVVDGRYNRPIHSENLYSTNRNDYLVKSFFVQ